METQEFVSQVCGVPSNRVNARVKRMGGAFGGKESRSVQLACLLAVAAKKTWRPVRCMLNRDEDMMTTGQRHPIKARWKVGTTADGTLIALEADVYNNAGKQNTFHSSFPSHVDSFTLRILKLLTLIPLKQAIATTCLGPLWTAAVLISITATKSPTS